MRSGISAALEQWLRAKQQDSDWENQVVDQGGTVDPQQSGMDRLRSVGGAIRRHLPGYNPLPEAEANMAAHPIAQPSVTPGHEQHDASIALHSYTPTGTSVTTRQSVNVAQPATASTRPSIGTALAQDGDVERGIYHGPHGQTAVMPTAQGREQRQTAAKEAVTSRHEQEQIDALTAGGMPAAEARARVLTNTVRYDDVFGQQQRGGLSGGEFDRREAEKQNYRLQLADLRERQMQARKTNDPFAERRLKALEDNLRLRAQQQGISIDEALARTPDPDPLKARLNEGNPAAAQAAGVRRSATQRLKTTRDAIVDPGKSGKPVLTQQQYDNGKAQGHSDADLSQHYDISKVRRRPDMRSSRDSATAGR
jgi:hypothetical protein